MTIRTNIASKLTFLLTFRRNLSLSINFHKNIFSQTIVHKSELHCISLTNNNITMTKDWDRCTLKKCCTTLRHIGSTSSSKKSIIFGQILMDISRSNYFLAFCGEKQKKRLLGDDLLPLKGFSIWKSYGVGRKIYE